MRSIHSIRSNVYCEYQESVFYNCFRRRNVDMLVDSTFDDYTFMSWSYFSSRVKQPCSLLEILLDMLAMQNCENKMAQNANTFKNWIIQNV